MLEQEELLYNENYPGKLCALCNLSERSTLGQGDIIKLKISIELDKKSIEKRSKTSSDATESDLSKMWSCVWMKLMMVTNRGGYIMQKKKHNASKNSFLFGIGM